MHLKSYMVHSLHSFIVFDSKFRDVFAQLVCLFSYFTFCLVMRRTLIASKVDSWYIMEWYIRSHSRFVFVMCFRWSVWTKLCVGLGHIQKQILHLIGSCFMAWPCNKLKYFGFNKLLYCLPFQRHWNDWALARHNAKYEFSQK